MASSGSKKNVTTNIKSSVVVEDSSAASNKNRSKLRAAAVDMSNKSEMENLKTNIVEDEDEYVYRGPKNNTGIFKNSLILKDLTGYQDEPETNTKAVNETIEMGTQTIEPQKVQDDETGEDTNRLLSYNQPARATKTYVGTPTGNQNRTIHVSSSQKNSIEGEGDPMRDDSLERLDKDAMSLQQPQQSGNNKQVNITNQINKTYIVKGGSSQKKIRKNKTRDS